MLPLAVLVVRCAVLGYEWAAPVSAALRVLISRELTQFNLNQLREALVSINRSDIVHKNLGEINQVLQSLK